MMAVQHPQKLEMVPIDKIVVLNPRSRNRRQHREIVDNIDTIGLKRPITVSRRATANGANYDLVCGEGRLEAFRMLGATEIPAVVIDASENDCLVMSLVENIARRKHRPIDLMQEIGNLSKRGYSDREIADKIGISASYVNMLVKLVPVQEHRMIVRAMQRGVPEAQIAEALGLDAVSVRRRAKMLEGICKEAVDLLHNAPCPFRVFDILRQMMPLRQIEAAELMLGQGNFSAIFARALLVATPENQLVPVARSKPKEQAAVSEQIARMEKELVGLQSQIKSVEETYGLDILHLTLAEGYVGKLLGNARVVRWLAQNHHEYLSEFQKVADIESIAETTSVAAE